MPSGPLRSLRSGLLQVDLDTELSRLLSIVEPRRRWRKTEPLGGARSTNQRSPFGELGDRYQRANCCLCARSGSDQGLFSLSGYRLAKALLGRAIQPIRGMHAVSTSGGHNIDLPLSRLSFDPYSMTLSQGSLFARISRVCRVFCPCSTVAQAWRPRQAHRPRRPSAIRFRGRAGCVARPFRPWRLNRGASPRVDPFLSRPKRGVAGVQPDLANLNACFSLPFRPNRVRQPE